MTTRTLKVRAIQVLVVGTLAFAELQFHWIERVVIFTVTASPEKFLEFVLGVSSGVLAGLILRWLALG